MCDSCGVCAQRECVQFVCMCVCVCVCACACFVEWISFSACASVLCVCALREAVCSHRQSTFETVPHYQLRARTDEPEGFARHNGREVALQRAQHDCLLPCKKKTLPYTITVHRNPTCDTSTAIQEHKPSSELRESSVRPP